MDLSASVSPSVGALFAGLPSLSIVSMVVSCRFVRVAAARKPNTERRHDVRATSTGVAFAAVEKESRLWIADELGRYFVMRFYLWCEIWPVFTHRLKKKTLCWITYIQNDYIDYCNVLVVFYDQPTHSSLIIKILFWVIIFKDTTTLNFTNKVFILKVNY